MFTFPGTEKHGSVNGQVYLVDMRVGSPGKLRISGGRLGVWLVRLHGQSQGYWTKGFGQRGLSLRLALEWHYLQRCALAKLRNVVQ